MSPLDKGIATVVLVTVAVLVGIDVVADWEGGTSPLHLLMEVAVVAAASATAAWLLVRAMADIRGRLHHSQQEAAQWREQAERWRAEAAQLVSGLSQAIDRQFEEWGLSLSEKEVALLLLKGLSLREVAEVRGVAEKTVRHQTLAIYRKAGLRGRADLSAFFLEDLLVPREVKAG